MNFNQYFKIFLWDVSLKDAVDFDMYQNENKRNILLVLGIVLF